MTSKQTAEQTTLKRRYEAPELVAIATSTTEGALGAPSDGIISNPS